MSIKNYNKSYGLNKVKETLLNSSFYINLGDSILSLKNSLKKLISCFEFLKPFLVLLHGSRISGKRFSRKKYSDYDMIIVSHKIAFWSKSTFYKEMAKYLKNLEKNSLLDISLVSCGEILQHLKSETSLGLSIKQGFTIIEV